MRQSKPHDAHKSREQRFEAIYRENYQAVLRYALRRIDATTANDIVAETFMVAWRRLDDIPAHAIPWLFGVARKALANRRRADARQVAAGSPLTNAAPSEQSTAEEPEGDDAVLAAVRRLPPREREAITLVAWDQLTRAEAARALGCTPVTFRVRLHRARKRLARDLTVNGEQNPHLVMQTATKEAK
jgi:RNA polymerase sigma factor (sigma-70 family)